MVIVRTRSRKWGFTLNNYTEKEFKQMSEPEFYNYELHKLYFQEEVGKSGTPHLQGCALFKNDISDNQIRKLNPRIHWYQLEKPFLASMRYCMKKRSRAGRQFKYDIKDAPLEAFFDVHKWLLWNQCHNTIPYDEYLKLDELIKQHEKMYPSEMQIRWP